MEPTKATEQTPERTASQAIGRVLLIGPDHDERTTLVNHLEHLGYHCTTVTSIEKARSAWDHTDVLAISADCADDDALRLIREAQAQAPCVRAVLYGGTPTPAGVVEAIRSGASDWITLPADTARLPDRMSQIMSRVDAHRQREERLSDLAATCKRLSDARDEMSDQVDLLCGDLASAYRTMREQMTDVALASEFRALLSQELDVEDMLRTSLEYVLKKIGPTNAAVYLQEAPDNYGVGAYVNYQWQDRDIMPLLRIMGTVLGKGMSSETDLVRFDDTDEFAEAFGDDASILEHSQMTAFSCMRGEECLAIFVLFRDASTPFTDEHATTLGVLREIITEQLSRIVRIHKRSADEWPEEPSDDGWNLAA